MAASVTRSSRGKGTHDWPAPSGAFQCLRVAQPARTPEVASCPAVLPKRQESAGPSPLPATVTQAGP